MGESRIIITKEELAANPDRIADMCNETQQPVFIENEGEIDLVLMSVDCYKQMGFDQNNPLPDFNEKQNAYI